MTRDEIMKLEGRELDAAIHSKVFGWREFPHYPHWQKPVMGGPGEVWYKGLPNYSENIADAWQVVGKMREKYPLVQVEDGVDGCACCVVLQDPPVIENWVVAAEADTPELAICRAVLMVVT